MSRTAPDGHRFLAIQGHTASRFAHNQPLCAAVDRTRLSCYGDKRIGGVSKLIGDDWSAIIALVTVSDQNSKANAIASCAMSHRPITVGFSLPVS